MRPTAPVAALLVAALALSACARDGDPAGAPDDVTTTGDTGEPTGSGATGTPAPGTSTTLGGGSEIIDVIETSFELSTPRGEQAGQALTITLRDPGSYTFRAFNEADIVHALQLEGHGVEVGTDDIQPGQSADLTVTLEEPGEYELYCPIGNHRELGMDGSVTVAG